MLSLQIIKSMEKLIMLHESLLVISEQKTVAIKEGNMEKLQPLLVKERKHVQALEQMETSRQKEVKAWFEVNNLQGKNETITTMLEMIDDKEQQKVLEDVTIHLTHSVTNLKRQEQLNQALIQQSLQFVELSLDMMNPSITNLNYGNTKETESIKRSVFDSKA
ncbi:flagellar protein FlgN [Virgibacillus necropolis]|uniref:Flagellar protein FlgN n=1 Tax=Virgibacillus necropolis TaxID=163877 RepID=A0A221MAQ6_9BACI|nr:flagellar protein FlgN [Virgibacillus necropolis]ASN04724.1 flagellar protein FlgN [Virgibacillus necropolis]